MPCACACSRRIGGQEAEEQSEQAPEEEQKKGDNTVMEKKIVIEGMMCPMCKAHVEKALNALEGVTCVVDLEAKTATVTGQLPADEVMAKAVTDGGYKVIEIK